MARTRLDHEDAARGGAGGIDRPDPTFIGRTFPLERLTRLSDGRQIEWERIGRGEDLIWMEGGPGFPAHLARPDVSLVADRFRCHLVNAPGCGRTSPPARCEDYSLASEVDFYESARTALGLGSVSLMGHSWGGTVAIAYAAAYPEHVRRLVVIDGFPGWAAADPEAVAAERSRVLDRIRDRPWFEEAMRPQGDLRRLSEAEWLEWWRRRFPVYFAEPEAPASVHHIERIHREMRLNMDAHCYDDDDVDLRPVLGRVRCPTLVIVGEHDWICGPTLARPIAEGIGGAELHVIPGVGHLPQYEAPGAFRSILLDWLDRTPAPNG